MKITIDRFEGDYTVVELPDRKTVNIPKVIIPDGAKRAMFYGLRLIKRKPGKGKGRLMG